MKLSRALAAGLVSVLAAAAPGQAQEKADLFRVSSWRLGPDLLDGDAGNTAIVEARAIEIDGAQLLAGQEKLRFELFEGTRYEAVLSGLERRGPEDVTWRGWLGAPGGDRVVLTTQGAHVTGMVFSPEGVYEIAPLAGGGHRLAQIDHDRFPECGGNPSPSGPATAFGDDALAEAADSADQIDVMIAYTPQARTAAGGTAAIRATAQSAVDMANTSFIDSGMVARFVLVSIIQAGYNDSGDMGADLDWLTSDAAIAAARDVARADMVGLIVEGGQACGVGFVMQSPAAWFASYAFQVTARSCAVGNLSYAHEHGHNMGMEHNPENGSSPAQASYPWSFGHYVNGLFRTVMSYSNPCANGCTRVARFSNPNLTYAGQPTGIADQRDNHRTGDLTAPIVANFRQRALGDFHTLTPCRLLDTRQGAALISGVPRMLLTAGQCGVPATASALAVNVTMTGATSPGYISLQVGNPWPTTTTTLHFGSGQSRGNNAIIPVSGDGAGRLSIQPQLQSAGTAHVIVDVSGYFN